MGKRLLPPDAHLVPKEASCVFKGIIFDVYQWRQKLFDGSYTTFEMLKRPSTLKVIAVKDEKIILVDQEQPNHAQFYDLPGGRHDVDGESELEATQRELIEETGMTFKNWTLIDISQPQPKTEQFIYLYLATEFVGQVDQKLDAGERIKILEKSFDEVMQLANDPSTRYLPKELLKKAQTLQGLLAMPKYETVEEGE